KFTFFGGLRDNLLLATMADVSTIVGSKLEIGRGTYFCLRSLTAHSPVQERSRSRLLTEAVQRLIVQLESDTALLEPNRLRERLDALDRLDTYFPCTQASESSMPFGQDMSHRANTIRDRLEIINTSLYESIRHKIHSGSHCHSSLQSILGSWTLGDGYRPANGFGYDCVDELRGGVFRFEEPEDGH